MRKYRNVYLSIRRFFELTKALLLILWLLLRLIAELKSFWN